MSEANIAFSLRWRVDCILNNLAAVSGLFNIDFQVFLSLAIIWSWNSWVELLHVSFLSIFILQRVTLSEATCMIFQTMRKQYSVFEETPKLSESIVCKTVWICVCGPRSSFGEIECYLYVSSFITNVFCGHPQFVNINFVK